MPKITFGNHTVNIENNLSVLKTLLNAGINVPFSCGSGICHCCKLKCVEGAIPANAQAPLSEHEKSQAFFLACQCHPTSDITVQTIDHTQIRIPAKIVKKERCSALITKIWVAPEKRLSYTTGQFINIWKDDTHCRSYSLASVPRLDQYLEFHIQRHEQGEFSQWLCDHTKKGTTVYLDMSSRGSCTYYSAMPNFPITLIGRHSGLAPLYGIVREALFLDHLKPIHLIYQADTNEGCYLDDMLLTLEAKHPNFTYTALLESVTENAQFQFHWHIGTPLNTVLDSDVNFKKSTVFICGSESFVNDASKLAFLAGIKQNHIFKDAFINLAHLN